ncbi:hypothetical protein ACEN2D_01850 [Corynebacterium auriscanis]|uniref:hypothetical protein n=1 Tax=Corynebacterium auriscanis TaxID=99807 RepID=UPI003CE80E4C
MSPDRNDNGHHTSDRASATEVDFIFVDPFQPPLKHRVVKGPKGSAFAVVQRFGQPSDTDDAPEIVDFFTDLGEARDLVMQRIVAEANRPDTGNDLYITHVKLRPAVASL